MSAKVPQNSLNIWRITDGKPGHEKQTLGLANALLRQRDGELHFLSASPARHAISWWLAGRYPPGDSLPRPDLILAAGHATHFSLLAARRAHGGKAIVLMRPSLPYGLFDLCLVPAHDNPPRRDNVLQTCGAITPLQNLGPHHPETGLILIGGPSSHFQWDAAALQAQVIALAAQTPQIAWTLTTSRRTPASFLQELTPPGNITVAPVATTPPGWLEDRLELSRQVWCSPDSVSMVYEALSAGCQVGLFKLPATDRSRVAKGMTKLINEGMALQFGENPAWVTIRPSNSALNEADRSATFILDKWFA